MNELGVVVHEFRAPPYKIQEDKREMGRPRGYVREEECGESKGSNHRSGIPVLLD
jgi:hypothetical protein